MNATEAMDRVIDDLNMPKSEFMLYGPETEKQFLKIFGMMRIVDLEHILFLGEIVLKERRTAILDMQRKDNEDGSLANYHSCER